MSTTWLANEIASPIIGAFAAGLVGAMTVGVQNVLKQKAEVKIQSRHLKNALVKTDNLLNQISATQAHFAQGNTQQPFEFANDFPVSSIISTIPNVDYLQTESAVALDKLIDQLDLLNQLMGLARQAEIQGNSDYAQQKKRMWLSMLPSFRMSISAKSRFKYAEYSRKGNSVRMSNLLSYDKKAD